MGIVQILPLLSTATLRQMIIELQSAIEDIERLRKEIKAKSPEEALEWWNKSAKIRATLESDEWGDTRKWLKEFLKVQAIYTDEQIDEVSTKVVGAVAKATGGELRH